jgi:hypothetical protein
MNQVVIQAVERVRTSGALWAELPKYAWNCAADAVADLEKMSEQEQLDLFEKAITALHSEMMRPGADTNNLCLTIDSEIREIDKACTFLRERINGHLDLSTAPMPPADPSGNSLQDSSMPISNKPARP